MNNNPFEPVTTDPAIDPPQTDGAADNFTADVNSPEVNPDAGAPKAPLSIDGISPNYGDTPNDGSAKTLKIDEDGESSVVDSTASDDVLTNDHDGDFLNAATADADQASGAAPDDTSALTPDPEPIATPPTETKPAKRVTISLLTIIFFILAIAGIAGAVWFYMQNSKNADALADSKAKVQQLEDELSTSATAENTTSGQYDGLSDKIEDLTGKNTESQKTIDDYKKKIDDQTKQITDLTTQNTDLTKKVQNISDLTTKLDTMLKKLDTLLDAPTT
jgi:methyl-accepting chemotaxis protein